MECRQCSKRAAHKCGECLQVTYCSAACQARHWGEHAGECAELAALLGAEVFRPAATTLHVTVRFSQSRRRNIFVVEGRDKPTLELRVGTRYRFDLSDASVQRANFIDSHPLFMTGGATSVSESRRRRVRMRDRGRDILAKGVYEFTPTKQDMGRGTLYYQCWNHAMMGGLVRVVSI